MKAKIINDISRIDMKDLHELFDKFADDEMIGVGNDLSTHYYSYTEIYRSWHHDTMVGSPGRYQVTIEICSLVSFRIIF